MPPGAEHLCFDDPEKIRTQDTKPAVCIHWRYFHPVPSLEMLLPTAEKRKSTVISKHTKNELKT